MNETSRCGCNRYMSERYNERRCNNERFKDGCEKPCGCSHGMNKHCCGWRPAPIRPCGCRQGGCGCENEYKEEMYHGRGCCPRPCPPRPCPCPPRPCHHCWGPTPYYDEMNRYDDYGYYDDMDGMMDGYWDDGYEMNPKKEEKHEEKETKEGKE